MKKVLLVLVFKLFFLSVYSINIKKLDNYILKTEKGKFIKVPTSFFVTDLDDLFLLDRKASNIKIFNKNGGYIKTHGRMGNGPGEYMKIISSCYSDNKFIVYDVQRRILLHYHLGKNNEIKFKKKTNYGSSLSIDMKYLNNQKILVAGFRWKDNTPDSSKAFTGLFDFNLEDRKFSSLLSTGFCFDIDKSKNVKSVYLNKIVPLGPGGFTDFSKDYIFYTPTQKLRIIRIDRKDNKKLVFKTKIKNFVKPFIKKEIYKYQMTRNDKKIKKLLQEMSCVVGLFVVNKSHICLLYTKYIKKSDTNDTYIQTYNVSGEFLKEALLLQGKALNYSEIFSHFQKKKNILYLLDTETTEDFDQVFRVHKFRIN